MNYKIAVTATLVAAAMLTACEEDTGSLGIIDNTDLISTSAEAYNVRSASVLLDSVIANSSKSYLGEIYDGETQTHIRAEFLTQFHTFENYVLPDENLIVKNAAGQIEADSVDVRMYFQSFYGDPTNPMKIQVFELDSTNVLREDQTYYSDINIADYLPQGAQPMATKTFSPMDYTLPEADRTSVDYYYNVRVRLPKEFGTRILNAANTHPEWFANSWQFIHHVCPGLYFKLQSGLGTMLELDVSALNVYFRYRSEQNDTIYPAVARFSATAEVIQSTAISNDNLASLIDPTKPYTYLKSPAGIATELTLPVDEIFAQHSGDSISRARLILTRMNSTATEDYALAMPQKLLLVRSQELNSFFKNRQVNDNLTSYTTEFDATYNTYTFGNLSRLLSYLHREKQEGMTAKGMTSDQWNAAYPKWNKVTLVPVKVTSVTNQSTGITEPVSITHDFSVTSTRIVGGSEPISIQVVYSGYK